MFDNYLPWPVVFLVDFDRPSLVVDEILRGLNLSTQNSRHNAGFYTQPHVVDKQGLNAPFHSLYLT